MKIINRHIYENILKETEILCKTNEQVIDIYHKNNWDHFVKHWDENTKNETCSYIDFFFDAKSMVAFLRTWLEQENFDECYFATVYLKKYKLKTFEDAVCRDIYDEFKNMINSSGLKVNTNKAFLMKKNEFMEWCDRFSLGGFSGVSEYSVLIPELGIIILPYHHMNYLVYSNNYTKVLSEIKKIKTSELCVVL